MIINKEIFPQCFVVLKRNDYFCVLERAIEIQSETSVNLQFILIKQ